MEHEEELEQRRANQRIRPPDPQPEQERESDRPMARLASSIGNQGFSSTLGRSPLAREADQGAGINADGSVHTEVQSTIDATNEAATEAVAR